MKKLATLAGTAALFAATLLPAFATAGNNCTNNTTGPLSKNYCTITNSSNIDVKNVNDAVITNNVTANANTGHNSASYTTLGGSVQTGNATVNTTVSTVANVNTTQISAGAGMSGNTGLNTVTGPDSDNRVDISNRQRVDVWNSNTATVNNVVNANSTTGYNNADYNTGPSMVRTGLANTQVKVLNHVNDTATSITGGTNGSVVNTGLNSTTGPLSKDYIDIKNRFYVDVDNVNDMVLGNWVNTTANTGYNSASYTTMGGSVGTGRATVGVGLNNEGNINTTTVQTAMGSFANNNSNVLTGPLSDNRETLLNKQDINVENWNNKCRSHNADRLGDQVTGLSSPEKGNCDPGDLGVFNYNTDVADTGYSVANYNTGPSGVMSGLADLLKNIAVHMNDNLVVIGR